MLAHILNYEPKTLSYLIYKLPDAQKYTVFEIPKKSGGVRQINAPTSRLKLLQKRLSDLLYEAAEEIDAESQRKPLSHGFRYSRSIITNASPHKNRRFVLNLDIENFFASFNFGRVRGFFQKNSSFALNEKISTIIAQIACYNNALPQGSPCSPIISDLIAHVLDVRLVQLAKTHKCTYTRYADDITFSTNQKEFPSALAFREDEEHSEWLLGQELTQAIISAGFSVNDNKTRMQCSTSRQLVTGLTVNKKVNIRADYYRRARAACDSLFNTGKYFWPGPILPPAPIATTSKIEGVLNHIHFVKDTSDRRENIDKKAKPTAARALYKDFLFFKYFVNLDRPLVLCEGKTDPIYLKAAIQKLTAFHPQLAVTDGKSIKLNIAFFNYNNLAHDILELGGGTGLLLFLIRDYQETMLKFKYAPMSRPVIILIDNDSGAKQIFSIVQQKFKLNPSLTSNASFYFLCHNLYLIKTPEKGATGVSMIEDFFEAPLLATAFEGKTFNSTNKESSPTEFGKAAFADFVRNNASKIDFSNFSALLDRIVAVLNDYKPPKK
ncbi:MAG: RNA-directed polymerase [Blastocatellia bacterium]|jgi:retron-type reverse transcriptase|nr:RNA-directed polymerase [Blastocatellia bacterium]